MQAKKILIVEDDAGFGAMLQKWFQNNHFEATWCIGMAKAKAALTKDKYDMALSDLRLPDGDGIMLLAWIKEKTPGIPVMIMTGYGEVQTAVSAIKLGAVDFLEKPINPTTLKQKIEGVFDVENKTNLPSASDSSKKKPIITTSIVEGKSEATVRLYQHIRLVAPTQIAVMIIGESGTGKEHAARMIHEYSPRSAAPFVAVDCGSLSMELAPSELFGHKKGSFTSAIDDKKGLFLQANGGTLFLDEVGNLPYGVQTQLLRVLQEKKIRPVGTNSDIEIDVRIVTATNENLEKAIGNNQFREDLYHRLNEFMIQVPPLRERAEDIELYALHFLKEANVELGKNVEGFSAEAMAILKSYGWPGNLRELRNVIRRAGLFATGNLITPEHLPVLQASTPKEDDEEGGMWLKITGEDECHRIKEALKKADGNKAMAARLLHIDRKTLYNKMHLYGIEI